MLGYVPPYIPGYAGYVPPCVYPGMQAMYTSWYTLPWYAGYVPLLVYPTLYTLRYTRTPHGPPIACRTVSRRRASRA